jgi:hypothetical protein
MSVLSPAEVTTLLHQRLAAVEAAIAGARATHEQHASRVPRLFLIELEYDVAMLAAEAAWMRSLIGELTGGTLPGLGDWRLFHETGEISDELRRLAEETGT